MKLGSLGEKKTNWRLSTFLIWLLKLSHLKIKSKLKRIQVLCELNLLNDKDTNHFFFLVIYREVVVLPNVVLWSFTHLPPNSYVCFGNSIKICILRMNITNIKLQTTPKKKKIYIPQKNPMQMS